MSSVGTLLKIARKQKKITLAELEDKTKIKKDFIRAIEDHDWVKLPDKAVTQGFVGSLAVALNVDRTRALALFKRDFQKKDTPSFKEVPFRKPLISPKTLFLGGIIVVLLSIAS